MRPSTGTGSSDVLDEMCPATFHSPLHRPKTLNYLKPHRSKPSGLLHCSERGMRLHSGKRGSLQTCLWARACRSGGLGFPISVICPSPFSLACDSGLCGEGGGGGKHGHHAERGWWDFWLREQITLSGSGCYGGEDWNTLPVAVRMKQCVG